MAEGRPGAPARRRTKIVATLGPATSDPAVLERLIDGGADVLRLNFSHGSRAEHAENVAMAREAAGAANREVGLLGDLPGPKLRIDEVEGGVVELSEGSELALTTDEGLGAPDHLSVSWEGLPSAVREGDEVYLADGRVRLRVLRTTPEEIRCTVEVGGTVASHQGLNMPGTEMPLPSAGRADLDWVDFSVEQGMIAGGTMVRSYLNKYSMAGSIEIPIKLHPNMPPGALLFYSQTLPYPLSNVANVVQMRTRRDYYQIDWPRRARRYEYGIYCDEVLQNYFPPAFGLLTNIADG